ncbi:MAG: M15 family metallopeptidase [Actinomycetota bacterium]
MMRKICLITVLLLIAAACGGNQDIYEVPPGDSAAGGNGDLPDPVPASPAYALSVPKPLTDRRFEELQKVKGVAIAAPIRIARLPVEGPGGKKKLRVAGVEPLRFRSVAPASTRDAEFVWVSLIVGHAVPTFDAAGALGIEDGGEISIDGTPGYKVGAFADNGVPNIADVIVQNGAERQLDLGAPKLYVIGAESGVTIETLGKDLRKTIPGARLRRLIPQETAPSQAAAPSAPEPVGQVSGGVVGAMRFQILEGGFIRPDPAWVRANIVSATVPIFGRVTCHRLMIPRLAGALGDVQRAGLAPLIRPGDYGGCYVPRFIDRDPSKPLSNHAFGLAVDFNVSTNGLGTRGDMDPRIVQIFMRWGFKWGGVWSRPDPMHFELTG